MFLARSLQQLGERAGCLHAPNRNGLLMIKRRISRRRDLRSALLLRRRASQFIKSVVERRSALEGPEGTCSEQRAEIELLLTVELRVGLAGDNYLERSATTIVSG